MEKKHRKKFQLKKFEENIKFRQRMLLIYIIGGIIPFMLATVYSNEKNKQMIFQENKKAQEEEISLICSGMKESMNVVDDVCRQIYEDKKVQEIVSKVAKKDYQNEEEFNKDCNQVNFIEKYLHYYKEEIHDIKIYVKNSTIGKNKYFNAISGNNFQILRWYTPTCFRNGESYWGYDVDDVTGKKYIQVTRAIHDEKSSIIGFLAIHLSSKKTTEKLKNKKENLGLIYAENDIISSSFATIKDYDFVFKNINRYVEKVNSVKISHGVKDYLVNYRRIYPDDTSVHYTVLSIQDYQGLMSGVTEANFFSVVAVIVGLFISTCLTIMFSKLFGMRVEKLKKQMHLVATGKYDQVEPIEGKDEVGQLYIEVEGMMKDIQQLTDRLVQEQVQKEKFHTKQKEVEFKMLASQINPHFIYNTLETIRMKARIEKQPEIEELVKMLAKIMRRNIQAGDQMVSLQSEIELIENYLVIQNYRFGDRIQSEVIVDEDVDTSIKVVPLIMQPFVENAYAHGLEAKDEGGKLKVNISCEEGNVIIKICDNGVGMNYYKLGNIRHNLKVGENSEKGHIGIGNVNQRLRILYGEEYGVSISSEENRGTCITLCFPADENLIKTNKQNGNR